MRTGTRLLLLLLMLSATLRSQDMYLCTHDADLYSVRINPFSSAYIGNTGVTFTDISLSSSGALYGISGQVLYSIDTANGNASVVPGITPIPETCNSLVCDQFGNLYASNDDVFKLDWSTGTWNWLLDMPEYSTLGDLTFYKGDLYLISHGPRLVRTNTGTHATESVGLISPAFLIYGLSTVGRPIIDPCSGDTVVGDLHMYISAREDVYEINPNDASTTLIGTLQLGIGDHVYGSTSWTESLVHQGSFDLDYETVDNVFTPNGDMINDVFGLRLSSNQPCPGEGSIEIFDRWGVLVYKGGSTELWDGNSMDGNSCTQGSYFWILKVRRNDYMEYKTGFVTLLR